jgi:hypothetical protein
LISPLNKIVHVLDTAPPGQQPYMNKAKASGGDRVNMLTNAYANKGIIMY